MRVIVIGGGISGLTAAFVAASEGHDVLCLEPSAEAGGLIRSERRDGFLCETGPQAVLDDAPETLRLIEAVGLRPRVMAARASSRRRFIFAHQRLWPLPMSPPALLGSGLLSWKGKLRLLAEPLIRRRVSGPTSPISPISPMTGADMGTGEAGGDVPDDETVLEFGDRRLGAEASRVLLATAVIGVYAGEAAGLSMASAFPRIAALEHEHGSLLRAALARGKARRRAGEAPAQPLSFPEGLGELPAALAARLGSRLVRARALALRPGKTRRWEVLAGPPVPDSDSALRDAGRDSGGHVEGARVLDADAVVVAASGHTTEALLRPLVLPGHDPDSSAPLEVLTGTRRAPVAIACLGFRDATARSLGMELDAYGFLVARGEDPRLLGCQYESSIFEGRAPGGGVLLRAILGGLGRGFAPEIVEASDDAIAASALADLRRIAGLVGEPQMVRVWRHPEGIPQYGPGHAARVAALDRWLAGRPGLHVIGHSIRGVGVNESIRAGADTARRLALPTA
jgi:oxygen-dependent protoporphyrinogen oxidase